MVKNRLCFILMAFSTLIFATPGFSAENSDGPILPVVSDGSVSAAMEKAESKSQLGEVKVEAKRPIKEGSAQAGYVVENAATSGPWNEKKLQDTPYSVNVISSELIENVGGSAPDQLFRINPLTQVFYPQTRGGNVPINIRGFRQNTSTLEDGMRNTNGYGVFLEDKERMEILSGLSGFLYGPGNVGGLVNYVIKRPTEERLNSITTGNAGGNNYYAHGDFAGKIDPNGKFGYRLNLLSQDGDTNVDYQSINKNLISGAMDWHLTDDILLQANGSRGHNRVDGLPAYWSRAAGVKVPSAPDPEKLWTQKWTFSDVDSDRAGINGTWDINDVFTLRAAHSYIENEREWHSVNTTVKSNGTYTQVAKIQAPFKVIDNGNYGFLDSNFSTGAVKHKLTTGFYGSENKNRYHADASVDKSLAGSFSLFEPVYVAEPTYTVGTKPWYTKTKTNNSNWIVGDDVTLTEQWSTLVGVNRATIEAQTYNTNGSRVANTHYDKTDDTPSIALMYKPISWVTTYAHYMESLEQGIIVPTTGSVSYTNAGEMLAPLMSKEYELGAKSTFGRMSLAAALFYIDKPNEYDQANADSTHTYVQDGREVHKGIEFTATGRAIDRLTLVGGVTLLNAEITEASKPELEGKAPMDVAEQMAKLYAEYDIPNTRGLILTGGIYYTGEFYADTANTDKLPAVVTCDAGARYMTKIINTPVILRMNVANVENKGYWINSYYTGEPRNVTFSAQVKF